MTKKEIAQSFIESGKISFDESMSYNDFHTDHHPDVKKIIQKIPADFDPALIKELYYYTLLNGDIPPVATEEHYALLTTAAAGAHEVLHYHGYPRCRTDRWVLTFIFNDGTSFSEYQLKYSLLQDINRFVHQPGILSKKGRLKETWSDNSYLVKEIESMLDKVEFRNHCNNRDSYSISERLSFICLLFILLLSNNEPAKEKLLLWFNEGIRGLTDIPSYKSRDQLVRDNVWTLFRFADAAKVSAISSYLLDNYGAEWCKEYQY